MKYIFMNLISFFRESKMIGGLTVVCVFFSSLVINFSYGLYQNYNIVIEKQVAEGENSMIMIYANVGENEGEYVSKEMFMECIYEIAKCSHKFDEKTTVIASDVYYDGRTYDFRFNIKDGKISISDVFVENSRKNGMISGMYWSDVDEAEGNPVALCYDYKMFPDEYPYLESIMVNDEKLVIDGKEYTIIGYQLWDVGGVMIPIMSVDGNVTMMYTSILFDQGISRSTYDRIAGVFKEKLGDLVYVEEIDALDRDSYYTYRTVIIIASMTALIASLNFMVLYRYILAKRQKKTAIYRICGLTVAKVSFYNIVECMFITIPLYLVGVACYDKVFLPELNDYFPYMLNAYSNKIYIILFMVYFVISVLVCGIMICINNKKRLLTQIRE